MGWIPDGDVYQEGSEKCLNGLFGVVKAGKFTSAGSPILRVIMNLVPTNRLFQVICGDIQLLPQGAAWVPLVMAEGEELKISQGDMSAAFYLFSVPAAWRPYMCFNYLAKGEDIGKTAGQCYRPCCLVLPMGWSSSVGIMQMLSRELLLTQGVPAALELHKGRAAPGGFTDVVGRASSTTAWWQVYLDNYMSAELYDKDYNAVDVSLQSMAMDAWHGAGVLTADDKQVLGANSAVELGVRLEGVHGLMGASPERLFKTILASVWLLMKHGSSTRDAQVVLGRRIFILQYRRAAMCVLSKAWMALEGPWTSMRSRKDLLR